MKGFSIFVLIWLGVLFLTGGFAEGQQLIDARSTGMAFSNVADARGLEQVGLNPAVLALPHRAKFEFNLFSVNVGAVNNSFSRAFYDRYLTTGDSLTAADKNNILSAVPASGLRSDVFARVNTFAFSLPRFSLALTGMGNAYFTLPKELIELSLNGNDQPGREYDFSTLGGVGWGGLSASLSMAFRLPLRHDLIDFAAVGFSARYLVGLAYFEVIESRGRFSNASLAHPYLQLDGEFSARTAQGGTGLGADLGAVVQTGQKWVFSIAAVNVLGSIHWNRNPEVFTYSVHTDSLGISTTALDDSLVMDEDSSYSIAPFSTRLPFTLDVGVAYRPYRRLLFTAEYEQALSHRMGGVTRPRFALGMEFTGIPFLPLRGGVSFGGRSGLSMGFGSGIDLGFWYMDVGVMNHGGFSAKESRGLTLAFTTRFRF